MNSNNAILSKLNMLKGKASATSKLSKNPNIIDNFEVKQESSQSDNTNHSSAPKKTSSNTTSSSSDIFVINPKKQSIISKKSKILNTSNLQPESKNNFISNKHPSLFSIKEEEKTPEATEYSGLNEAAGGLAAIQAYKNRTQSEISSNTTTVYYKSELFSHTQKTHLQNPPPKTNPLNQSSPTHLPPHLPSPFFNPTNQNPPFSISKTFTTKNHHQNNNTNKNPPNAPNAPKALNGLNAVNDNPINPLTIKRNSSLQEYLTQMPDTVYTSPPNIPTSHDTTLDNTNTADTTMNDNINNTNNNSENKCNRNLSQVTTETYASGVTLANYYHQFQNTQKQTNKSLMLSSVNRSNPLYIQKWKQFAKYVNLPSNLSQCPEFCNYTIPAILKGQFRNYKIPRLILQVVHFQYMNAFVRVVFRVRDFLCFFFNFLGLFDA